MTGLSLGRPRAAHGPKFKIPLPRSFVLRPTECALTSAQWSRSFRILKMLTPRGRMFIQLIDRLTGGVRQANLKVASVIEIEEQ